MELNSNIVNNSNDWILDFNTEAFLDVPEYSLINNSSITFDNLAQFQDHYYRLFSKEADITVKLFWKIFAAKRKKFKDVKSKFILIYELFHILNDRLKQFYFNPLVTQMCRTKPVILNFRRRLGKQLICLLRIQKTLFHQMINFFEEAFIFALKVFNKLFFINYNLDDSLETTCFVCHQLQCLCAKMNIQFFQVINILRQLELFNIVNSIIKNVFHDAIDSFINNVCKAQTFDNKISFIICNWFYFCFTNWIKIIYDPNENSIHEFKKSTKLYYKFDFRNFKIPNEVFTKIANLEFNNLREFIIDTFVSYRIEQLFDILLYYPDSALGFEELADCLKINPSFIKPIIDNFSLQVNHRLLNSGIPTSDILEMYINAIRALPSLDLTGVVTQNTFQHLRHYLANRPDTVFNIICMLNFENITQFEKFRRKKLLRIMINEEYWINQTWQLWRPLPINGFNLNNDLLNSDIIALLFSLFDDIPNFVNEYKRGLARRLIYYPDIDMHKEFYNIEILGKKFNDKFITDCHVMLVDYRESARIYRNFKTDMEIPFDFGTLFISENYWPSDFGLSTKQLGKFNMPDEYLEIFDVYEKYFLKVKDNRILRWHHKLGLVIIEIEFENCTREFYVTPIQICLIRNFQDQHSWTVNELYRLMKISPNIIRKNLGFWVEAGVLQNHEDTRYDLILAPEFKKDHVTDGLVILNDDLDMLYKREGDEYDEDDTENKNENETTIEDDEQPVVETELKPNEVDTTDPDSEESIALMWKFIENMFNNIGPMQLQRIFTVLKMFKIQSPKIETLTIQELKKLLDASVKSNKLLCSNGTYSLSTTID